MTKNRDLGNLAQTVAVNLPTSLGTAGQSLVVNSSADGLEFGAASGGSGVTVYTGLSGTDGTPSGATYLLNASSPSAGDLAYVSSNTSLYQNNGNGWYRIAVINTTPTISSVADASSNTTPFTLEGGTNTVITVTASDVDEGTDLTYSYSVTSGSLNGTTVTQGTGANENVFTIAAHASNATTFSLTFTVSDSINAATSVAAFTLEFSIADSHYTTLLMATDGSAGDNNDITDSSSSNHTITVNGDAHAGTFSPYRHGGYSTYFDGTGDYLSISDDASLEFGSDNFTLEMWYKGSDTDQYATLTAKGTTAFSSGNWSLMLNHTVTGDIAFYVYEYSNSAPILITGDVHSSDDDWVHIAVVRSGSSWNLYVNGTSQANRTSSITLANSTANLGIGADLYYGRNLAGYISDYRIVNGTAVYTGNFTPPTERLTAVSGTGYSTSLLTCHLPYIADGSSNGHTITVNGNTSTKPFTPYDNLEYSAADHGGSIILDGSDYLTYSHGALGSGNWTIEGWTYITSLASSNYIFDFRNNNSNAPALAVTDVIGWDYISGGAVLINYSSVPKTNTWYHFAIVKNNGTTTMYINGSSGGTYTDTLTYVANSAATIGKYHQSALAYLNGYISDLRVVEGTAVYTGNFTPPTGPLTTTGGTYPSTTNVNTSITASNTKLLLKGTDAHVLDKSQVSNLKLGGTAASTSALTSGSTPPYIGAAWANTSAVSFDGDSDYVFAPYESIPSFGAGEFTIEAWVYFNSLSGTNKVLVDRFTSGNSQSFQLYYRSTGSSITFFAGTANLIQDPSSSTISAQTWHHVAVTRDASNNVRLYVDGLKKAQSTSSINFDSTIDLHLGAYAPSSTNYLNGYMQDVRLSNKAFYTADDHSASSSASIKIPSAPLKG